jgi:hypothetical protein
MIENEKVNEQEKKKLIRDLQWWIYDLDELEDMDMLYELTDLKTDYEDRKELEEENNQTEPLPNA